jgi:hypothetical protein
MEMLPYAEDELMASMAAISLRRLQQISPSEGGRRVPPPPSPHKISGKLGHPFFCREGVDHKKTEAR